MQVFTPAQAKIAAEQRTSKDALRAKGLADITKELLKEKELAETEFKATMEQHKKDAEDWFKENFNKKDTLLKEIEKLEKRKQEALSPLLINAEDIHSTQEALASRELIVQQKETEIEEEARSLMHKLDKVADIKQSLDERENRVKRQELGNETQRNQIANDAKKITVQLQEFLAITSQKETDIAFERSELDARKNLLDEVEKGFIEREKEIEAAKRLLADQRVLLEKGFKELELKQK